MYGKTLPEAWGEAKQIINRRRTIGKSEFPTGFNFLDNATDGLGRGEIWIISGRTGSGKTTLALQLAREWADNPETTVCFVSLEMKASELCMRLFCEMFSVNFKDLKKGFLPNNFEEKEKIFNSFISKIDFEIFEYGYKFDEIQGILDKSYKNKKPDILFIDYIQLIECSINERKDLDEYIRKLKELSKVHNISIILLSQIRRLPSGASYDRPPDLIDLKGTGMLEQSADKVLFIHSEDSDGEEKYFINLAKNRQGETLTRQVYFQKENYRFRELTLNDYNTERIKSNTKDIERKHKRGLL